VAPSRVVPGGTRVYHYLNNVRVLEYELDSPELRAAIAKSKFKDVARFGKLHKGHILIQDHGDRVWYRNIKILPIAAPTSSSDLAASAGSTRSGRLAARWSRAATRSSHDRGNASIIRTTPDCGLTMAT
jgi:hypothetical protein